MSEITGKPLKTVANWLILILIFVFDPLAIALIIATNQSFKNLKPKLDVDNEPLPPPSPQTPPLSQLTQNNEIDFKIDSLKKEINKTQNSTVSSKKKGLALNNLNEQLKNYQDLKDNQIEY